MTHSQQVSVPLPPSAGSEQDLHPRLRHVITRKRGFVRYTRCTCIFYMLFRKILGKSSPRAVHSMHSTAGHGHTRTAAHFFEDTDQLVRAGDLPGITGQHARLLRAVVADGVGLREDGAVVQL